MELSAWLDSVPSRLHRPAVVHLLSSPQVSLELLNSLLPMPHSRVLSPFPLSLKLFLIEQSNHLLSPTISTLLPSWKSQSGHQSFKRKRPGFPGYEEGHNRGLLGLVLSEGRDRQLVRRPGWAAKGFRFHPIFWSV